MADKNKKGINGTSMNKNSFSSGKQADYKSMSSGFKSSSNTSKTLSSWNSGQKNSSPTSKALPSLKTGLETSLHATKSHSNSNAAQKSSQPAFKTNSNFKVETKSVTPAFKTNSNFKVDTTSAIPAFKTNSNYKIETKSVAPAFKTNSNYNVETKSITSAFKTNSDYNVETKNATNTFKPNPTFNTGSKSSPHTFTTQTNWSTLREISRPAFKALPTQTNNWALGRERSPPPAFKIYPTFNGLPLRNTQAHLDGYLGLGRERYPIRGDLLKGRTDRGRSPESPPRNDDQTTTRSQSTSSNGNRTPSERSSHHDTDQNEFDCPTCNITFLPQIYQCTNGHSSCSSCKEKNWPCGICGRAITDMRNFALEEFLAEKQFLCPFNTDGCELVTKMSAMYVHIKECPFRMLDCPAGCSFKMPLKKLASHFASHHPSQRLAGVGSELKLHNIYEHRRKLYFVQVEDCNFLFHEWVSSQDRRIYMAAQLIGTKDSASKWFYEVQVCTKSERVKKYTFSEICTSFVESVFDIFRDGRCCILTQEQAATFLHDSTLTYKLFIYKMDESKTNPYA